MNGIYQIKNINMYISNYFISGNFKMSEFLLEFDILLNIYNKNKIHL